MASVLKVDKLDPQSGTALELGTSGDTISLPSGATLDISASTLTPPATMPASSGINFTALNATNLGSGTVPTARLGTGTASSSTVLYGDQTYKAEPGGGITVADDWKVTTSFTGAANPISANLAQTNNAAQGQMGSAMTVSSGIWTFPSTGYWYVAARAKMLIDIADGNVRYDAIYIKATINDSAYSACSHSSQGVYTAAAVDNMNYETFGYTIIDVTDVANVKVQFEFDTNNTAREVYAPGGTATDTGFTFIRLGDT